MRVCMYKCIFSLSTIATYYVIKIEDSIGTMHLHNKHRIEKTTVKYCSLEKVHTSSSENCQIFLENIN